MTALPAAATPAAPGHPRGGRALGVPASGGGPSPWHGQKVHIPRRVWGSGYYSDAAVAFHAQVTALDQRRGGCTAGVQTLATYLGTAKTTAERALRELNTTGPDGITEMTTTRHTAPGGTGTTAERHVRRLAKGELWAFVPIDAAKALRARLFRVYCALTYAQDTGLPVTAAEVASLLVHHSGARAGRPVGERTARRAFNELERLGWISIARRTGHQGRHEFTVHDHPLHPAPSPDTHDGSGPDRNAGSLVIKEDHVTDRLIDTEDSPASAVGDLQVQRARVRAENPNEPASHQHTVTLPVRVAAAPVRPLLDRMSPGQRGRAAAAIATVLATGMPAAALAAHLTARYAPMSGIDADDPGRITSPFGWLVSQLPPVTRCALCGRTVSGPPTSTTRSCVLCDEKAARAPRPGVDPAEACARLTTRWTADDAGAEDAYFASLHEQQLGERDHHRAEDKHRHALAQEVARRHAQTRGLTRRQADAAAARARTERQQRVIRERSERILAAHRRHA